jgi:hypothetical protein
MMRHHARCGSHARGGASTAGAQARGVTADGLRRCAALLASCHVSSQGWRDLSFSRRAAPARVFASCYAP